MIYVDFRFGGRALLILVAQLMVVIVTLVGVQQQLILTTTMKIGIIANYRLSIFEILLGNALVSNEN